LCERESRWAFEVGRTNEDDVSKVRTFDSLVE
jgi:hypothetical protein